MAAIPTQNFTLNSKKMVRRDVVVHYSKEGGMGTHTRTMTPVTDYSMRGEVISSETLLVTAEEQIVVPDKQADRAV